MSQQSLDELKIQKCHATKVEAGMPLACAIEHNNSVSSSRHNFAAVALCAHGGFDNMHACMPLTAPSRDTAQRQQRCTCHTKELYAIYRDQETWGGLTERSWWNLRELADDA